MVKVILLGNGNVAIQLAKAFLKTKKVALVQVYSRSQPSKFFIKKRISTTSNIADIKEADLYIIAIADDAISSFSKKLSFKNKLVVHTSGSVSLNDLKCSSNKGVFYPLQTLSKSKKVSFKKIPICLEANSELDVKLLEKVAKSISKKVYKIDSKQRKNLHVAAVFVNNFVNHLYKIGNDICEKNNVDFNILKPLISETSSKIKHLSPLEAQTGPAKRNDQRTIEKHLEILNENQQEIYKLLSNSIKK